MLISDALEQFKDWGAAKYAPTTIATYSSLIRRFVEYMDNQPVESVDITDVTDYFRSLKQRGYHDSSIAYMMIALRQFFRYFFLRRIVDLNFDLIPVPKYVSESRKPIEPEESRQIIERIKADNFIGLRDRTICAFFHGSGLRVSELCSLKLRDFRGEYAVIVSKKNRVKRMVFWDARAQEYLEKYLRERKKYATSDMVFISMNRATRGSGLTTRSVQRVIEKYRPGTHITTHSYRHALGVSAVQASVHMRHIQKILGHKNINSSQVYLDVQDKDVVRAYREIERVRKQC